MAETPLLQTIGLTKHFRVGGVFGRMLHAVDDASLTVNAGEIVAIVGESGSGKSTLARLVAKVFKPTAGEILFEGRSVADIRSRRDLLAYRGKMPMVFQDPFASLNPVHRIGYTLGRALRLHRPTLSGAERQAAAEAALEAVGLSPARQNLQKYPHELSGGQRQRVGFAVALSYQPKLVLADEPVSMLDVSIRIGLLNLMALLCAEEKISFLYITHDIASARYVSQRIVVMYAGRIVETGPTEDVLHRPAHPYTRLLLSAVPDPKAPLAVDGADIGEPPLVIEPGEGCRFLRRCPLAAPVCGALTPALRETAPGQLAACHVTAG
jgi:peptide/nickel transport system ATP-binding protein